MYTIDVDFETYKQLTLRRTTEDVSYNDVIRELLGLSQPGGSSSEKPTEDETPSDWVAKGVRFPAGTDFRASYKGQTYTGRVQGGSLVLSNGQRFGSPSAAAVSVTGNAVNGWRFWECRFPGKSSWKLIEGLRR